LKLILAASAALAAYLVWQSFGWPLIHDAPLMHYIAWVIAEGGVPYRDVFDMNLPGVYLLHAAIIAVGGRGDLAWRLFDLGWLAATMAVLWAYARPLGRGPAAAGTLLFGLYHLAGGAWRVGQRDFLLCLFLLAGALGVARSIEATRAAPVRQGTPVVAVLERGGALPPLVWTGLALGAGLAIKPHAGVFWIAAGALAGWGARRRGLRPAVAAMAIVLGLGLVPSALVFTWLASRGGAGPFVDVFTGYVVPLYSRVGRVSLATALGWYQYGALLWTLLLALALLGLARATPGHGVRKVIAAVGAVCGALHFFLQGKYWEYQLYPLAAFLCALVPFAMREMALPRAAALTRFRPAALGHRAALVTFAATVAVLGAKGADALEPAWIADKARRVAAMTRDLGPLLPPGGTVQVMDVTEGGVHALYNLGRRQPTRFIYDFHFFHDTADPRIRRLRDEFVAGISAGRPAAIVILRDTWNHEGYERLDDWPAIEDLLARDYRLAVDGDGYRIYAKRADS